MKQYRSLFYAGPLLLHLQDLQMLSAKQGGIAGTVQLHQVVLTWIFS